MSGCTSGGSGRSEDTGGPASDTQWLALINRIAGGYISNEECASFIRKYLRLQRFHDLAKEQVRVYRSNQERAKADNLRIFMTKFDIAEIESIFQPSGPEPHLQQARASVDPAAAAAPTPWSSPLGQMYNAIITNTTTASQRSLFQRLITTETVFLRLMCRLRISYGQVPQPEYSDSANHLHHELHLCGIGPTDCALIVGLGDNDTEIERRYPPGRALPPLGVNTARRPPTARGLPPLGRSAKGAGGGSQKPSPTPAPSSHPTTAAANTPARAATISSSTPPPPPRHRPEAAPSTRKRPLPQPGIAPAASPPAAAASQQQERHLRSHVPHRVRGSVIRTRSHDDDGATATG